MSKYTRRSAAQWQALVEEQERSALSAPQFCKEKDLGYASFCQWRKRLSQSPAREVIAELPPFLAVDQPTEKRDYPQWVVELQLSPDIVLCIGR